MSRLVLAIATLATFATVGAAQPPLVPSTPNMPPAAALPEGQMGSTVIFPVIMPWGWGVGWGYQTYNPWVGYRYVYGGVLPSLSLTPAAPPAPALPPRPEPTVVLAEVFPARLSLSLPEAAEVWLNGKKVGGKPSKEQILTSPAVSMDQPYTFNVKARWTSGGKTYEAARAMTVNPGEQGRLMILSGNEIRE